MENKPAYFEREIKLLNSLVKEGKIEEVLKKYGLGLLCSLDGEARISIEKYLKVEQKEATDLYNFGVLALQKKNLAEAENFFKKAIDKDEAYASPHYNLALIYESRNETSKARKEWEQFITKEEAYQETKGLRINGEPNNFNFLLEAKAKLESKEK